jgi:hypothetical protein
MKALLKARETRNCSKGGAEMNTPDLNALVLAMGKRLQAEYVEGAIPYLREREPEFWARLEMLDQEESMEALLEYERLFFEGLHRYVDFLEGARKAA